MSYLEFFCHYWQVFWQNKSQHCPIQPACFEFQAPFWISRARKKQTRIYTQNRTVWAEAIIIGAVKLADEGPFLFLTFDLRLLCKRGGDFFRLNWKNLEQLTRWLTLSSVHCWFLKFIQGLWPKWWGFFLFPLKIHQILDGLFWHVPQNFLDMNFMIFIIFIVSFEPYLMKL